MSTNIDAVIARAEECARDVAWTDPQAFVDAAQRIVTEAHDAGYIVHNALFYRKQTEIENAVLLRLQHENIVEETGDVTDAYENKVGVRYTLN